MKMTNSVVKVSLALMENPQERHWGYKLWKVSGIRSGVLYPILNRMLQEGWLEDGWEDESEVGEGRPPRRYYSLTERGAAELGALIARAENDRRFTHIQWGWST